MTFRTIQEVIARNLIIGIGEEAGVDCSALHSILDAVERLSVNADSERLLLEWIIHATRQLEMSDPDETLRFTLNFIACVSIIDCNCTVLFHLLKFSVLVEDSRMHEKPRGRSCNGVIFWTTHRSNQR